MALFPADAVLPCWCDRVSVPDEVASLSSALQRRSADSTDSWQCCPLRFVTELSMPQRTCSFICVFNLGNPVFLKHVISGSFTTLSDVLHIR